MKFDPTKPVRFRKSLHPVKIVYISDSDVELPLLSVYEDDDGGEHTVWNRKDGLRNGLHEDEYDLVNIEDYSIEIEFLENLPNTLRKSHVFNIHYIEDMCNKIISILKDKNE